jgi:hypothetical protein
MAFKACVPHRLLLQLDALGGMRIVATGAGTRSRRAMPIIQTKGGIIVATETKRREVAADTEQVWVFAAMDVVAGQAFPILDRGVGAPPREWVMALETELSTFGNEPEVLFPRHRVDCGDGNVTGKTVFLDRGVRKSLPCQPGMAVHGQAAGLSEGFAVETTQHQQQQNRYSMCFHEMLLPATRLKQHDWSVLIKPVTG